MRAPHTTRTLRGHHPVPLVTVGGLDVCGLFVVAQSHTPHALSVVVVALWALAHALCAVAMVTMDCVSCHVLCAVACA